MPKQATSSKPTYVMRRMDALGKRLYASVVVGKDDGPVCRVVWVRQKRFASRGTTEDMHVVLAHADPSLIEDAIAVRLKPKAKR